jgi:hypothetical protein
MYTLLGKLTRHQLFSQQIPSMLVALVCAELFYKFHSFILECAAFLVTWFVFDALSSLLYRRVVQQPAGAPTRVQSRSPTESV